MPKCLRCADLKEQITWLREQNKSLADRLIAISSPNSLPVFRSDYTPMGEYYGSSDNDQVLAVDEFGQHIPVGKEKVEQKF